MPSPKPHDNARSVSHIPTRMLGLENPTPCRVTRFDGYLGDSDQQNASARAIIEEAID